MGFGSKLSLIRWGLPSVHSPFTSNSSPPCCSASIRSKELDFSSGRMPLLTISIEESEVMHKDSLRPQACSSAAPQTIENDYSNLESLLYRRTLYSRGCCHGINGLTRQKLTEGLKKSIPQEKVIFHKRSLKGLHNNISETQVPIDKDISVYVQSVQARATSNFHALMDNINVLENKIADSDSLKLEQDILIQLRRLGALELFHACLSRTHAESTLTMSHRGDQVASCSKANKDNESSKKFVPSKRKGNRILKQHKKVQAISEGCLCKSEMASEASTHRLAFSGAKKTNPVKRRVMFSKNEAELARGIQVVAKLEKVKAALEKETKRTATLSCWAEVADIDKHKLQHDLQYGWYCRDELLKSGRSLVLYLARNYRGLGVAHEDLIQAGNIGILQGAERYDHTRGYQFSTYVRFWIRKAMSQLVSRHRRGIKVPMTLTTTINRIQKARKILKRSHGRHPDDDEVAQHTGLSLDKIMSADKCLRIVGSIDQNIGNGINIKFLECTPDTTMEMPEKTVMKHHMRNDISKLLQSLDPKERHVLMLRYGFGGHCMSLHEIGKIFDVSKEWIRKMEKKALTKLKNEENQVSLRHYLNL